MIREKFGTGFVLDLSESKLYFRARPFVDANQGGSLPQRDFPSRNATCTGNRYRSAARLQFQRNALMAFSRVEAPRP